MLVFSLTVKRKKFQRNSILKTKTGNHYYLPTPTFNYNRTHSMAGFSPISQCFNKLVSSVADIRVFIQNALKFFTRAPKKGNGPTGQKMEWIRHICFFITALVLSLAIPIPERKKFE